MRKSLMHILFVLASLSFLASNTLPYLNGGNDAMEWVEKGESEEKNEKEDCDPKLEDKICSEDRFEITSPFLLGLVSHRQQSIHGNCSLRCLCHLDVFVPPPNARRA